MEIAKFFSQQFTASKNFYVVFRLSYCAYCVRPSSDDLRPGAVLQFNGVTVWVVATR